MEIIQSELKKIFLEAGADDVGFVGRSKSRPGGRQLKMIPEVMLR